MKTQFRIVLVAAMCLAGSIARSDDPAPEGEVLAMAGRLTFTLDQESGPLAVRFAGLDLPPDSSLDDWFDDNLVGQRVRLILASPEPDRYGRLIAQVYRLGEGAPVWLQQELVEAGHVRVVSHADNFDYAEYLMRVEAEARSAGRGLWADRAHRVRDTHPDALAQDLDSVQIVAGRVTSVAELDSGRVYINFGTDYRTDFTVRVDADDVPVFRARNLEPLELEGRRVEVRGWLDEENGPMIRLDHPERLRFLDEAPPG